MRIDAHQHYWQISRTDYGWLQPSLGRIYRDFMPPELLPHLERHKFARTIIVQAAPSEEETEFLLGIAEREPSVAGVVGWLDFEGANFGRKLQDFLRNPKFIGLRPMIQDLPSEWLLLDRVVAHVRLLADACIPLDLQANPRHLPSIVKLLEAVPHLLGVIDHLAKPPIEEERLEPWLTHMERVAAYPGMMCKLSGMVPEHQDASWSPASVKPFAQGAIDAFGTNRIMFGSDWPVCLYSASYDEVVELVETCLGPGLSESERANVYGRNAARFYHL